MPTWLFIAKGPVLRFALAIFCLGLLRLIFLSLAGMLGAWLRAGDKRLPVRELILDTLSWLVPVQHLHRTRPFYSFASFAFHGGLLITALFLQNHIDLLAGHTGLRWVAIAKPVLDVMTVLAITTTSFLILHRIYQPSSRRLSRPLDYILLIIILLIISSGFLAGQNWNPIPYDGLMLAHTLAGILLIIMIPFTKISHCVLFPLIRFGSEMAWHFTPQGGERVIQHIYGSEGRQL